MMLKVRDQRGLTLIETVVALFVFSVVTLGITPLITSALRGSATSRSYTIGKNLAVNTMERIRGLPYFVSTSGVASPTRRDVLDLYYPNTGSGYSAGKFTTVCSRTTQTPAESAPAACPSDFEDLALSGGTSAIPDGYTIKIETEFVKPGIESGGEQSFDLVTPPSTYNWATLATESPPAQMVRIAVTATWPIGTSTKTFALTSLIGERTLSPDRVRARANVDFGIQAVTSYLADDGRVSTLTSLGGRSISAIGTRSVSGADQDTRAGRLTLSEHEDATTGAPGTVLQDLFGAGSIVHAPPDSFYAPDSTALSQTATYQVNASSSPTSIAFIGPTSTTGVGARVLDELPRAEGMYTYTGTDLEYWVDNQASTGSRTELLLHGTRNMLTVRKDVLGITGSTKTESTAIAPAATRKVQATATAKLGRMDLFPTTFISQEQRAVVVISDFQVSLTCTSTADPGTASVAGTWSAKVKYWKDLLPADDNDIGAYTNVGSLDGTIGGSVAGGTEALEGIQTANPLVYDSSDDTEDVYLFVAPGKKGYLQDWSMTPEIAWTEDAFGRTTSASLEGAMQIITNATNPAISDSALNITLGKVGCQATDKR
jgi:prepilin-type N-terminal cleavage/methylation domain-containing protein